MTAIPTAGSTEPDRLAVAITDAVADGEGCDPVELAPLYQTVDPEALDKVFAGRPRSDGKIAFEYSGYGIVIDDHGLVVVDDDAVA